MTVHKIFSKKKILCLLSVFFAFVVAFSQTSVFADLDGMNNSTGFRYVIKDDADFLTDSEEKIIEDLLEDTTNYCNVMIIFTNNHSYSSTEDLALSSIENNFGYSSTSICFVVDRRLNEICLCSEGRAKRKISNAKCDVICDNTYIYATKENNYDYYTCTYKTISQVNTVLSGGHIAQPMKYISSAFISLALGMLFCFIYALRVSHMKKATGQEILSGIYSHIDVRDARTTFTHQTKQYVSNSSNSGGHGGGRSGGGRSGGHASHSSGSHRI